MPPIFSSNSGHLVKRSMPKFVPNANSPIRRALASTSIVSSLAVFDGIDRRCTPKRVDPCQRGRAGRIRLFVTHPSPPGAWNGHPAARAAHPSPRPVRRGRSAASLVGFGAAGGFPVAPPSVGAS